MPKTNPHCKVSAMPPENFSDMIQYFLNMAPDEHKKRGVDATKLPSLEEWLSHLMSEHNKPVEQKKYFCLGWYYDHELIGHSCIDNIEFGEQSFAHLHIWKPEFRHKKLGNTLARLSLKYYFEHFKLKRIYGQPNAENNEANQVTKSLGFQLIKHYKTIPHPICFEQYVNLYLLEAPKE